MTAFSAGDWPVIFPSGESNIYGSVYSGTFSVPFGRQVADVTPERIARVVAFDCEEGDYAETDLALLVELIDGTFAACMAWCDTTGWDCQSGAAWKWAPTRELVIEYGLDREARRRLGVALPVDVETSDGAR